MEPHHDPGAPTSGRHADFAAGTPRPVVWPWLVVPAITLAVFFALRSLQQDAMRAAPPADAPERAEAAEPAEAAEAQLTPAG